MKNNVGTTEDIVDVLFVFAGRLGKIFVDTLPSDIRRAHGLSRIHIFWLCVYTARSDTIGDYHDDVYIYIHVIYGHSGGLASTIIILYVLPQMCGAEFFIFFGGGGDVNNRPGRQNVLVGNLFTILFTIVKLLKSKLCEQYDEL